jgi:hypothetical protein
MNAYRGPKRVEFRYPAEWTLREEEAAVTLWKTAKGGAITVSIVDASGGALQHCARFAEKHAFDPPRMSGDRDVAEAAFTDQEGAWCKVKVLAAARRMVLATYHATVADQVEEAEADAILASLKLVLPETD